MHLLEVMVVLVIITILALMLVPLLRRPTTSTSTGRGVNGRELAKFALTPCGGRLFLRSTMKKLLSLLMCYVFLQTESFALRGGPNSSGTPKVYGFYSGVLIDTGNAVNSASMGLFLLSASGSGASTGQVVIFSSSTVGSDSFNCVMTGLSDTSRGGSGKFTGIFSGAALVGATSETKSISGAMSATAVLGTGNSTPRLKGTATSKTVSISTSGASKGITIDNGNGTFSSFGAVDGTFVGPVIKYIVDGFQVNSLSSGFSLGGNGG